MKSMRLPALVLIAIGVALVLSTGSELTHSTRPATAPSTGPTLPTTGLVTPPTIIAMPPTRTAWPTPTAVPSRSSPVATTRSPEPSRADTAAPTATTETQPMTGTGVAIVQRAIAAVNSITSYHFLFTSHEYSGDDYEVEGNVIAANPAREVDTITERKAGKQTQRTIMIIGASAWDYKDGQWVTHQSTGWFDPLMLSETAKLLFEHITIADYLGDATLDGQPVYHLALTYASPPAGEIWIGTTNYYPYLLQGESGTGDQRAHVTMKFSRFNDPAIKIAPP